MRIAVYQPDIPQNVGAILRLGACLGVPVELIEPFGFVWDDRRLKRAGMDYLELADATRHRSWPAFREWCEASGRRLVLVTRHASLPYQRFAFAAADVLLLGRESAGVPAAVHDAAAARIAVPLRPGLRSLNVAVAGAMVLGEALRQLDRFPLPQKDTVP
ncbi:MAG: tRNA (cytidine(34)-2'-O)-methyltransferase [Alphaproteobacteria bacterium]|nr:tRNA (cytidine(34)-2'-O)-methyltransferase [Alphaproteobacteria bacterium]